MKRKLRLRKGSPIIFILVLTLFVVNAQGLRNETAQSLWEKALEAKGGIEHLRAISNFVIKESAKFKAVPFWGPQELHVIVCAPPGKVWELNDYRPGKMGISVTVYNQDSQLGFFAIEGRKAKEGFNPNSILPRLMKQYQWVYFVETEFVRPKALSTEKSNGFDLVHTDLDGQRIDFYLDPRSHLPARIETVQSVPDRAHPERGPYSHRYLFELKNYKSVSGIQVPTRVLLGGDPADAEVWINVDLDPRIFVTPPDGVTSGDAGGSSFARRLRNRTDSNYRAWRR